MTAKIHQDACSRLESETIANVRQATAPIRLKSAVDLSLQLVELAPEEPGSRCAFLLGEFKRRNIFEVADEVKDC